MVKKLYQNYIGTYRDLRPEVWWLALVTLINRSGTMVVPFLSLYLKSDLGFDLKQIGWILSAFGMGSIVGAWLGGRLTDKWGFYPVIFWSLFLSGFMFIIIQFTTTFWFFCILVFILMVVADSYRPAVYVAIKTYSRPENRTRSITLIRLAINLGFSVGPAIGGLIIVLVGYGGIFWIDGLTCISASILFITLLNKKQAVFETEQLKSNGNLSPYRDGQFLLFLLIVVLIGFVFLQYFSTIPLYYREIHNLSEGEIGLLMSINGLLIFFVEMPLIKFFDRPKFSIYKMLIVSSLLFSLSFLVLNWFNFFGVLAIGIVLMTFGEMLNFPFLNKYAMERAEKGKSGAYMALFTMGFGLAQLTCHNAGMHLIDRYGYEFTWKVMAIIMLVAVACILTLMKISQISSLKNYDK